MGRKCDNRSLCRGALTDFNGFGNGRVHIVKSKLHAGKRKRINSHNAADAARDILRIGINALSCSHMLMGIILMAEQHLLCRPEAL